MDCTETGERGLPLGTKGAAIFARDKVVLLGCCLGEDAKESDLCNAIRAGHGFLAARSSEQGAGDGQMTKCSSAHEVQQCR